VRRPKPFVFVWSGLAIIYIFVLKKISVALCAFCW
jgi:hypothetical protein